MLTMWISKSRKESLNYDIGIIDAPYNGCGLAVLNYLRVPTIGFWPHSFTGQVMKSNLESDAQESNRLVRMHMQETDFTTAHLPASSIPVYTSQLGRDMGFLERAHNLRIKFVNWMIAYGAALISDRVIQLHLPESPR